MSVVNFAEYVRAAIQAGEAVEGSVVRIIADNGQPIGDAVFKVIEGGNGTASEVAVGATTSSGGAVATGVAYLAIDVGVVGAALAPCFGALAGYGIGKGIYSVDPEFWATVSDRLFQAGQTVNGKIIAYWNGTNVFFSKTTIEIFKQALVDINFFQTATYELPEEQQSRLFHPGNYPSISIKPGLDEGRYYVVLSDQSISQRIYKFMNATSSAELFTGVVVDRAGNSFYGFAASRSPFTVTAIYSTPEGQYPSVYNLSGDPITKGDVTYYVDSTYNGFPASQLTASGSRADAIQLYGDESLWDIIYTYYNGVENPGNSDNLQNDATYPNDKPFEIIWPNWLPWEWPITPGAGEFPEIYPAKYPEVDPDPYPDQEGAQDPDEESDPDIYPYIEPDFPIPDPNPDPFPDDDPDVPDPDPDDPDPDPIEPTPDPPPEPDPVDPNPWPYPTPIIPDPVDPPSVNSNRLFTVYNPGDSQLNALGGYLWDSSIIATIRDIWQNPLDGIISLIQVYAPVSSGGSSNIILGFLDTGIACPVVSGQFVTVDCGSVTLPEKKQNATDYAPYTSLHLYLPFIGVVELDCNECMNGSIGVKYKVDVYTGTCLATVSITRDADMPHGPILYTYSGNCSQQIPLTSGNATGMLNALIGGITAGLSVASGGSLSALAGAQLLGNSLTHEMFHVSHSGNISANAGIMGHKKPYIIIGRRHSYDANAYYKYYGYPSNKTVYLSNCKGFTRVKKCLLNTSALQSEYDEIINQLQEGVIF